MSDDLVNRLREDQPVTQDMESTLQCALQDEAADRIEELEAKLARAVEAFTPSTQTKAKFMGEFHVPLSMATDWGEETRLVDDRKGNHESDQGFRRTGRIETMSNERKINIHTIMYYIAVGMTVTGTSMLALGTGVGLVISGVILMLFHALLAVMKEQKDD